MLPQFDSSELNQLLQLELTEGTYQSPEDVLLAGMRSLRERRMFQSQLSRRLASIRQGRGIVLKGDEALGNFLDEIDAEVDAERQAQAERIA